MLTQMGETDYEPDHLDDRRDTPPAYIFLVISETLYSIVSITDDCQGPLVPYCLCELVAADTREQARWDVYRTYVWFNPNSLRYMPKFRTAKIRANRDGLPRGIVSDIVDMNHEVPAEIWNRYV